MAKHLRNEISALPRWKPLVRLSQVRLCMRHWKQLSDATHRLIDPSERFTLAMMRQRDLHAYETEVHSVCDQSEGENAIERALEHMQEAWSNYKLHTKFDDAVGAFMLLQVDDLQHQLDAHLQQCQRLKASEYSAPFSTLSYRGKASSLRLDTQCSALAMCSKTGMN